MKLEEFNYNLPKELIAQEPAEPRDSCRLMMVDKKTGEWEHHHFRDILDEIREGDLVYFVCEDSQLQPIFSFLGNRQGRKSSVLIIGGGNIGLRLARVLEKKPIHVKLLDKNPDRCAVSSATATSRWCRAITKAIRVRRSSTGCRRW